MNAFFANQAYVCLLRPTFFYFFKEDSKISLRHVL
jgi:hypothetical protein